ncbi:hypothetical protein Tco_0427007, partial [Tanacetum coccineum]
MPSADSYSVFDVATLNTRRTPFQKQPELLFCLVGKSLAAIGLGAEPPSHTSVRQTVSKMLPNKSSKIAAVIADPDSENTSFTSMAGSPGSIYQPG